MQNWVADCDDVFVRFNMKLKRTKQALSKWSKECYGNIFKQLIIREDTVRIKEQLFEDSPTAALNRAHVEYYKYLEFEEEFWR